MKAGTFKTSMHGTGRFHWTLNKSRLCEISTYLLSVDSPAVFSLLTLGAQFLIAIL